MAALNEPGRTAARQGRGPTGCGSEPVAPLGQSRFDQQGGRLKIIGPLHRGPAQLVPCSIDRCRGNAKRWREKGEHAPCYRFPRKDLDQLSRAPYPPPTTEEAERYVGAK